MITSTVIRSKGYLPDILRVKSSENEYVDDFAGGSAFWYVAGFSISSGKLDVNLNKFLKEYLVDKNLEVLEHAIWTCCSIQDIQAVILRVAIKNHLKGNTYKALLSLKELLDSLSQLNIKFLSLDAITALAESGEGWIRSIHEN